MITYLFGAGASFRTIPIVDKLPPAIKNMSEKISRKGITKSALVLKLGNRNVTLGEIATDLCKKLDWLADSAAKHASIDTFAKKLYLKGKSTELLDFKAGLMAFLALQQVINSCNERYDSFYASLLRNTLRDFPQNVKILTWNYDNQFEKSYVEFSDGEDLHSVHYKFVKDDPQYYRDFGVYKLNGSTVLLDENSNFAGSMGSLRTADFDREVGNVCANYYNLLNFKDTHRPGLSFAWEDSEFINNVAAAVKNTRVLVIIGYSLPYFNRPVDQTIIRSMEGLHKIYIQDPIQADKIEDRLNAIVDIGGKKIQKILDKDQFFLPHEL